MINVKDLEKEELMKLEVEETNLEDLIILGTDKLINILITYPEEVDGKIEMIETRAKIKQLTIRDLKNIDLNNFNIEIVAKVLRKALFTQEEKPFGEKLILDAPIGVCIAIAKEIMRISGVDVSQLGF